MHMFEIKDVADSVRMCNFNPPIVNKTQRTSRSRSRSSYLHCLLCIYYWALYLFVLDLWFIGVFVTLPPFYTFFGFKKKALL